VIFGKINETSMAQDDSLSYLTTIHGHLRWEVPDMSTVSVESIGLNMLTAVTVSCGKPSHLSWLR